MKQTNFILALLLITCLSCAQQVESEIKAESPTSLNYSSEIIVPDINIPWGMAFLPDGSMLITEKSGELIHFKNGEKIKIAGLPEIYVRGQGGLMDIKLHPKYDQ